MKLKITSLGTPKTVKTVNGDKEKNYLKAEEYNDKFLNFWVSQTTAGWKVGDEIEVEAVEERPYTDRDGNPKTSFDIKLPKFGANNAETNKKLEEVLNVQARQGIILQRILNGLTDVHKATVSRPKAKIIGTDIDYPEMEDEPTMQGPEIRYPEENINVDDIPF